jgi:hypothetical protein
MSSVEEDFNGMAEQSRDMLTRFLKPMLDIAKKQLDKHQGFLPFGAFTNSRAELTLAMADDTVAQTGVNQLSVFADCLRSRVKKEEAASAVACYDCRVVPPGQEEKSDAVCIHYEDELGERWDLFFPYIISNSRAEYQPWHYEYGAALIYER